MDSVAAGMAGSPRLGHPGSDLLLFRLYARLGGHLGVGFVGLGSAVPSVSPRTTTRESDRLCQR